MMRLYHEIVELHGGSELAMAVARPIGSDPIPPEHATVLRRAGDVAPARRDQLYFTRVDDTAAYVWHLIPSPMRALERTFQ